MNALLEFLTALLEYIDLFIKIAKTVTHYARIEGLPIMLALCFMLWHAYYAKNHAGIIDAGLLSIPLGCIQLTYIKVLIC